jgi:hypothetical protein
MVSESLTGSIRILFVFDVCEEIRLDELRRSIGAGCEGEMIERRRDAGAPHPSPEFVRFERPPMVQQLGPVILKSGERFQGEANYYDYGSVSLKLQLPFELDWPGLVALASKWIADTGLEAEARQIVRRCLEKASAALMKPNREWLAEDYYIVHVHNQAQQDGSFRFRRTDLIARHGNDIAKIVRGELVELSESEKSEILASQMSYYPNDLMVAGWTAAFLCDTPEGALPTVQLLEYANTQLLEFRYYDAALTGVLERVYDALEKRGGPFARWRLVREARNLNKIRLDVRELTERMDTAIKFVSDMFSARQYRMAASKIGVEDYRRLVESKLSAAGDLYTFMMDQFYASRGFTMELIVVIILVIELVFAFRGRI